MDELRLFESFIQLLGQDIDDAVRDRLRDYMQDPGLFNALN
jgi:hypothetical protein